MATWNPMQNITVLGETVSVTQWNNIFGPDQSMQYVKDRADFLSTNYYYKYTSNSYTLTAGWPQGDPTDLAATGDVFYPTWINNGVSTNKQYITLTAPAKYLCIVQCNVVADQEDYRNIDSILRLIINDTGGCTNFSTTNLNKATGSASTGTLAPFKYSVPFALDVPYTSDLIVGFAAVQNYENAFSASAQFGPVNFQITSTLMMYRLPIYKEPISATTQFVVGTTILNGTSRY